VGGGKGGECELVDVVQWQRRRRQGKGEEGETEFWKWYNKIVSNDNDEPRKKKG